MFSRARSSALQPAAASGPRKSGGGPFSISRQVVAEVPLADRVAVARGIELLHRILAHRLEHRVAAGIRVERHERLVDESREELEDVACRDLASCGNGLGGVEREPAREHGEAAQQRALRLGEKVVAPVDQCAQRLLSRQRRPVAGGEQAEAVVDARGDLLDRQRAQARCRELERERNAVEAPADLHHGGRVAIVQREGGLSAAGPLDEQAYCLAGPCGIGRGLAVQASAPPAAAPDAPSRRRC